MVNQYEGIPLVATYEVKDSGNAWHNRQVLIESQEDFNHLINVCNRHMTTMNLIDIQEAE